MLEISAGAVVFTLIDHDLKYVIIHDNNGNYGFPKGHQEKDETLNETAIREIKEEIGIDIELLDDFKKEIFYTLPNGNNKQAIYFLATYNNQELKAQEGEINKIMLLSYKEAYNLINFMDVKNILESANNYIIKHHLY